MYRALWGCSKCSGPIDWNHHRSSVSGFTSSLLRRPSCFAAVSGSLSLFYTSVQIYKFLNLWLFLEDSFSSNEFPKHRENTVLQTNKQKTCNTYFETETVYFTFSWRHEQVCDQRQWKQTNQKNNNLKI